METDDQTTIQHLPDGSIELTSIDISVEIIMLLQKFMTIVQKNPDARTLEEQSLYERVVGAGAPAPISFKTFAQRL